MSGCTFCGGVFCTGGRLLLPDRVAGFGDEGLGVLGLVGADVVDVEHGAVVFVAVRFDPGGERA